MPAKKKKAGKKKSVSMAAAAAVLAAPAAPAVPLVRLPAGGSVTIAIDLPNPSSSMTVVFGGTTLRIVNGKTTVSKIKKGSYILSWGFLHPAAPWSHKVSAIVDGKTTVLDARSSQQNDPPSGIGVAVVEAV